MLDRLKNDTLLLRAVENYLKAHYWKAASFYQIFQLGQRGEVLQIKEGFEVYAVSENIEIIGLIANCGNGLVLVHFLDERAKAKYSVLKTLLSLRPACLKGDRFSVALAQRILEKSILYCEDADYYWMCLKKDQLGNQTEKGLLEAMAAFKAQGVELCLANQLDFQTMIPFLIEVEKYFDRNPLSVNQLKKKMTERSLLDAYIMAASGGQIVGQGLLEYALPKHRLIGGIYVAERHRKQGIGTLITRALIQAVAEKASVPALTVAVDNPGAIRIYEYLGFQVCGDQRNSFLKLSAS